MIIDLGHIEDDLSLKILLSKGDKKWKPVILEVEGTTESPYQIFEGNFYEYEFLNKNFRLDSGSSVVQPIKNHPHIGRIEPNTEVGKLIIGIEKRIEEQWVNLESNLELEVQSIKADYRSEYRYMLQEITERATDLIFQINKPVYQSVEVDYENNYDTLYQRFTFLKSIINSEEFELAVYKIIRNPTTKWEYYNHLKDVRSIRKFNAGDLKKLIHGKNSLKVPADHPLRDTNSKIKQVSSRISTRSKVDTVDTTENRFVKHALKTFYFSIDDIKRVVDDSSQLWKEANLLLNKLNSFLIHTFFDEIGRAQRLHINSPALQRKEGYRTILKSWFQFDLAASLCWEGGNDVYETGKKRVSKLYEYWLFFELLAAVRENFEIESSEYEKLIRTDEHGLVLKLKEGNEVILDGIYRAKERDLNIEFCYNKTFSGESELEKEGSWTLRLRPDYTISIWPAEIDKKDAERENQIVHIHFDSKYKVKTGFEDINEVEKSSYKSSDIHKMHTYKDAIRRTAGAYVLYPGLETKDIPLFKGFHEIIPGLGAFPIRPEDGNTGIEKVISFINDVKDHFLNRASQRENISVKSYDVHKDETPDKLNERLPEYIEVEDDKIKLIPEETYILVGYVKSEKHLNFYLRTGYYNFRMGKDSGSLGIDERVAKARYLLLRESGKDIASRIYKLKPGIEVYSKQDLIDDQYPEPNHDSYLIYHFIHEHDELEAFEDMKWKFKNLEEYQSSLEKARNIYEGAGTPFCVSMVELMDNDIVEEKYQ